MAIPRGPREQAWHVTIGLCVLATAALPQLRTLVPLWVLVLTLTRYGFEWMPPAWLLQRATLLVSAGSGLFLFARLGQSASGDVLVALLRDDTERLLALLPATADQGALLMLCQAGAGLIVSTLLRFDLRAIRRDIVDERVWARQQARRRQVMAAHHRRQPPPETV